MFIHAEHSKDERTPAQLQIYLSACANVRHTTSLEQNVLYYEAVLKYVFTNGQVKMRIQKKKYYYCKNWHKTAPELPRKPCELAMTIYK